MEIQLTSAVVGHTGGLELPPRGHDTDNETIEPDVPQFCGSLTLFLYHTALRPLFGSCTQVLVSKYTVVKYLTGITSL